MSPMVRTFVLGFMLGFSVCLGFINYYGELGGTWLIELGQKMKVAAQTKVEPVDYSTRSQQQTR
jgi:hypothetical protein